LAALTVGDFDARQGTLRVAQDKAGAGRTIPLPPSVTANLKEAVRSKLPSAPLFARWDGKRWRADEWVKAIKAATASAGLPVATVAYSLRHSSITDLVTDGLDLFTVA
jgi:integrase